MKHANRSRFVLASAAAIALVAGITFAREQVPRPGFQVVILPTSAQVGERVETKVLLETPHLRLVSVLIPKGAVLAAPPVPNQVSLQALSGSGEVRTGDTSERLDGSRLIVVGPGVDHEIQAGPDASLVLLVHHVLPGPRTATGEGKPR